MSHTSGARWKLPGANATYIIVWWYDREAQDTDRHVSPSLAIHQLERWMGSHRLILRSIDEELSATPLNQNGGFSVTQRALGLKRRMATAFQSGTLVVLRSRPSAENESTATNNYTLVSQEAPGGSQPKKQVATYRFEVLVPSNYTTLDQMYRLFERTIYGEEINSRWSCGGYCDMAKNAGRVVPFLISQQKVKLETSSAVNQQREQGLHVFEQLPDIKKKTITHEIDRRYRERTGDKSSIPTKRDQPGKALVWQQQQSEVMQDYQTLEELTPSIKALLTSGSSSFRPKDYQQLLRIAKMLEQFTPQDLELFKAVAVRTTHDLNLLERSVSLFLARKEEFRQALEQQKQGFAGTPPATMGAAIDASWTDTDLSQVGRMSASDQYALAQRQSIAVTRAQLAYTCSHPGELAVDVAKTVTLVNTGETFSTIGKKLAEAADGDASTWARWAAGAGAGSDLSGWLLAVGGVLYVLSWFTGVGELATIAAVMGKLLMGAMALSLLESELRIVAAAQAKTPEDFKRQVNESATARLKLLLMGATLAFALAIRFVAKTYFPQAVKGLRTSLSRLREQIRLVGRLSAKKALIVLEMQRYRSLLERAGDAAKTATRAQVEALQKMSIAELIVKMESGELLPEGQPQEGQKVSWKQLAETPEGLRALENYKHRLTSLLRSEVLEDIDALVQEQITAIDETLKKVHAATLPEELAQAINSHEAFLAAEEVGARAKAREQRALRQAAEDPLEWEAPPPPELRTLAEKLRRPISEINPEQRRAKRSEITSELRDVHGARRPPKYEGHIFDKVLAENQAALARSRAALHRLNPDIIVGMERGGAFLTEALVEGDPVLAAKVRRMPVHKAPAGVNAKYNGAKMQAEFQKLIDAGARKIVIYDAFMGGRTARALANEVFKHLSPKNPGVTFQRYWLRETFGLKAAEVVGEENLAGNLSAGSPYAKSIPPSLFEDVTLVLGDDMDIVMNPTSRTPIQIFNSRGQTTEVLTPEPGKTTRHVLIKLLNRPPAPIRSSRIPALPAPSHTSTGDN